MNIEFLDVAEAEFTEAIAYYNQQSEGLGYEFAAEVRRTISRIVQYPEAWAPLSKRTRRCRTNRFPYGVIYQVRSETILIVAIMHLRQDPQTWKDRVRSLQS
ncbi:MAG: type II toxin-antitoxin system RelE/ParE family toxin [Dehalococcoidia bacterium]